MRVFLRILLRVRVFRHIRLRTARKEVTMKDGEENGKELRRRGIGRPRLILHLQEDRVDLGPDQGHTQSQDRDQGHRRNRLHGRRIDRERGGIVRCLLMGG